MKRMKKIILYTFFVFVFLVMGYYINRALTSPEIVRPNPPECLRVY